MTTFVVRQPKPPEPWGSGDEHQWRTVPAAVVGTQTRSLISRLALASLCLFVFAIPWEDAITIEGVGTSARLIGAVAMGLGLLSVLERGTIRRAAMGHLMLALFVLSAAMSCLWSLQPDETLTQTLTYVQLFSVVWLIWEIAPQALDQTRLMQAYIMGTLVSGVDTFYRFLTHKESVYQRYAGAHLDANDLGLMVALSIPISYFLLLQTKGRMVWLYRLHLALAVTTVLLTASRGATVAAIVALAIVPLTQSSLTLRQKVAVGLTFLILVVGALLLVPETSWRRVSTIGEEFTQGTMTGRTIIWQAGWEIFREHPYFGIGTNAFRATVCRQLGIPIRPDDPISPAPPAHNTFLSVLVEEGIFGFAIFAALLGVLALSLRTMPHLPRKLWTVCLLVWVVGVSSLTWEMRKPTWLLFGLLMAQSGTLLHTLPKPTYRPISLNA